MQKTYLLNFGFLIVCAAGSGTPIRADTIPLGVLYTHEQQEGKRKLSVKTCELLTATSFL